MFRKFILVFIFLLSLISWKNDFCKSNPKTKEISIGIGEITVPISWKNISVENNEEKIYPREAYQFLIGRNDTMKFGDFLERNAYDTMIYFPCINEMVEITDGGGSYLKVDSACLKMNKEAKEYNDSLCKANPEIRTHTYQYFMAADSAFHFYCYYPCRSTPGIFYGDIYEGKNYDGKS